MYIVVYITLGQIHLLLLEWTNMTLNPYSYAEFTENCLLLCTRLAVICQHLGLIKETSLLLGSQFNFNVIAHVSIDISRLPHDSHIPG
jgi:hypothetical protein